MSSSSLNVNANVDELNLTERYVSVGDVVLHVMESGSVRSWCYCTGFRFWYSGGGRFRSGARRLSRGLPICGYNDSDKPKGVRAYGVRYLADDIAGLVRACGAERASSSRTIGARGSHGHSR